MSTALAMTDRFALFEQMTQHQVAIDRDASRESAQRYVELYWPDATFTVHDLRTQTFEGPEGLKQLYDFAHSVFPLSKWRHSVGSFDIDGGGDDAVATWRWIVSWGEGHVGTVSTGTYTDRFQRRDGRWKCLQRTSDIDPNWPADLFQPYVDLAGTTFRAS